MIRKIYENLGTKTNIDSGTVKVPVLKYRKYIRLWNSDSISFQETLTQYTHDWYAQTIFYVFNKGHVHEVNVNYLFAILIKSEVKIISGNRTKEEPYELNL